MSAPATYVAIVLSLIASTWCWWRIWQSDDPAIFKAVLAVIAALPILGPFLYLFADMPPRHRRLQEHRRQASAKPSAFLRRWNEREHVYLGWASFVFWMLALVAYWMNDWRPGNIHAAPFNLGHYTDVDVLFFALLIGAVLTFGAALRAKALLVRRPKEASNNALYSDTYSAALRAPSSARKRGR
jgi:hypothetical protein